MVLKGVLRDVHVFAIIYHKRSPVLSLEVNGKRGRKREPTGGGKKTPKNKEMIQGEE